MNRRDFIAVTAASGVAAPALASGDDPGPWLDFRQLRAHEITAVDARGQQVPRLRACREVPGGIEVRCLVVQRDAEMRVMLEQVGEHFEVVEFTATIRGGRIVPMEV